MVAEHQAQPTSSKATTATRTPKPQTIHLKFEMRKKYVCFKSQSCETNETYKQLVWIHFTLCEYNTPLQTKIPVSPKNWWKIKFPFKMVPFSGDMLIFEGVNMCILYPEVLDEKNGCWIRWWLVRKGFLSTRDLVQPKKLGNSSKDMLCLCVPVC